MDWVEISVHTTSAGSEAVSEMLFECGAAGTAIEDDAVLKEIIEAPDNWDYVDEELVEKVNRVCNVAVVKGYLPDDDALAGRLDCLKAKLGDASGYVFDMGTLEIFHRMVCEEDWANNWKQYYKPIKVGKRVVIKPSWEAYEADEDELVVELDPGMAFGTGTHETTQLCIRLLEDAVRPGCAVLDVGTGTGILAIAAWKLGAGRVIAVDIDPKSVEIAKENTAQNNAGVTVMEGDLLAHAEPADVIVANIIADAIVEMSPDVVKFLRPGGAFIASGIIKDRERDVVDALAAQGLRVADALRQGEWVALLAKAA